MFDVTTEGSPTGLRGRLGRVAHRFIPDLDQKVYARARGRDRKVRQSSPEFDFVRSQAARQWPDSSGEPTVVVVPPEGPESGTWEPARWNIYFEASQRLRETSGGPTVLDFHVDPGETPGQWQARLIDFLRDSRATHLLTHIERDPVTEPTTWTWDSFWDLVHPHWQGVLLGGMFDSSYRFTEAKAKILAKISPSFALVDICIPMDGALVRRRPEVGPVNIPMSNRTLELVDSHIANQGKEFDISFMGVMYDYRVELVRRLQASGLSVAVNPHRSDDALDADATRRNQPSWLDYMRGLAASRATINFSRSNAGPFEQLKTRVVEVGLAGTYLLTDDHDRTRRFWRPGTFSEFNGPDDLVAVSERILNDASALASATDAFGERARFLARHHYWGAIEATLRARGLPSLGIEPFTM